MNPYEFAQDFLRMPQAKAALQQEMREAGFAEAEISAAVLWLHADWKREALLAARQLAAAAPPLSRQQLREALRLQKFLPAEVDFALESLAVNWFDRAAQTVVPADSERALYLYTQMYTDQEIAWALEISPEDEEEIVWQQAQYILAGTPFSKAALQEILTAKFTSWLADRALLRLGDIWSAQAQRAASHLLGRYGALLSKKRLLQFLQAQKFTLEQIAAVLRDFPGDWEEQALQCALFYARTRNLSAAKLKKALKDQQFAGAEIRSALQRLKDLEKRRR